MLWLSLTRNQTETSVTCGEGGGKARNTSWMRHSVNIILNNITKEPIVNVNVQEYSLYLKNVLIFILYLSTERKEKQYRGKRRRKVQAIPLYSICIL